MLDVLVITGIDCKVYSVPWSSHPFPDYPKASVEAIEGPARTARLIIYKQFLREHNLKYLYLGHHLDDMVETALLRQGRGTATASALPGLRPIAKLPLHIDPASPRDNLFRLLRPLLQHPKVSLSVVY